MKCYKCNKDMKFEDSHDIYALGNTEVVQLCSTCYEEWIRVRSDASFEGIKAYTPKEVLG
jgi:hypothetical protein